MGTLEFDRRIKHPPSQHVSFGKFTDKLMEDLTATKYFSKHLENFKVISKLQFECDNSFGI